MDTDPTPPTTMQAAARLLIHAKDDACAGRRHFALRHLRRRHADSSWRDERAPLHLRIDDLQGNRLFSVDDAGSLVEVPLPAGTYHISAHRGNARCSYTMTLEPGMAFDLRLHLVPDRQ